MTIEELGKRDHSSVELEKQLRIEELTRERDKFQALAELGEGYRRERDVAADSALMFERDEKDACRERDEARAYAEERNDEANKLQRHLNMAATERDDLKKRLLDMVFERNDVRDKLDICALDLVTAKRERDEARAEVAVAYRLGAEAMREACADCVKHLSHEDGLGMGSQRLEGAIRALPIPEEP